MAVEAAPVRAPRGMALILVVGVLGILAVLAGAFMTLAQLERKASLRRLHSGKAMLLAHSGIEDAMARLAAGQDPAYLGEDWDGSGALSGFEPLEEVQQPGTLDTEGCLLRHALRPSFFVRSPVDLGADGLPAPATLRLDGRRRACTGRMGGNANYALKVEDLNARIHINGGALDGLDRDPDGPSSAPEGGPLTAGMSGPDHRDVSMEGPNGFLVRMLDNLERAVTGTLAPTLGSEVVGSRPLGGYDRPEELIPVLGAARYAQFKGFLTVSAWVDPKVLKPQPMNGRPFRFLDVDDAHRIGTPPVEVAGVHADSATTDFAWRWAASLPLFTAGSEVATGTILSLNPGISGSGTEASPWTVSITHSNLREGANRSYPVSWERNFVYAHGQLRLAPAAPEPRAPVSVNAASREVLASLFLSLRGSYLEVWEGSGGWDSGWSFYRMFGIPPPPGTPHMHTYPYPSQATEDTPWYRTRLDYGKTYGTASRPWYGSATYNPHANPPVSGGPVSPANLFNGPPHSFGSPSLPLGWGNVGGKPLIQCAPLGRLKETTPLTRDQALAIATQIRLRISQCGPFRTWEQFNAFVRALPSWEDVNGDGVLDGTPYTVTGDAGAYTRRVYRREDANSDGTMQRQTFTIRLGTWVTGITWKSVAMDPSGVPGLTLHQKDLLRAMANPNTDLNDFNPDGNLWKEIDKTDVAGLASAASSYVHTTELSLDSCGLYQVSSLGRVPDPGGKLLAQRHLRARLAAFSLHRDTTQADFMREYTQGTRTLAEVFLPPPLGAPYPLAGGQVLVSYPEPQTLSGGSRAADAAYDGQVSLGFVGNPASSAPLNAEAFDTTNILAQGEGLTASGDSADADVRGPFHQPLLRPAGQEAGNVFPDGVYSEKDRAVKFPVAAMFAANLSVSFWIKPNWFPEASPRPHTLFSFTPVASWPHEDVIVHGRIPVNDLGPGPFNPFSLTFVPNRNASIQGSIASTYSHSGSGGGDVWPCRSLVWGFCHSFWMSDSLNLRGISVPQTANPVGRLEGHRWVHISMEGLTLKLGGIRSSANGGGWQLFPTLNPKWNHQGGAANHARFGEAASAIYMNYVADATYANLLTTSGPPSPSPALLGRYVREDGARFVSSLLPAGAGPLRVTWTEVPAELWFDRVNNATGALVPDGWPDASVQPATHPENDQFGASGLPGPNGLRDVRIDLEVWDDHALPGPSDDVLLGRFSDPAARNALPRPVGRVYYKAVFVNEWDAATRANFPLDVTPFLDDVTVACLPAGDVRILDWEEGE